MDQSFSLKRRLLYCAISAALVCLSFPNVIEKTLSPPTAFLAWVALVPFFLALRGVNLRLGFLLGLVFGFLQFGSILYWIAFLQAAEYLSGLAWFALVLYLALYTGVFGLLYAFTVGRLRVSSLWVAPFAWVGLEYFRGSRPWGGFSWGEIAYSQAPYPRVLVFTSLAGVYGLSFLMIWANLCLAKGLEPKGEMASRGLPRWAYFLIPLAVLGSVLAWGGFVLERTPVHKAGTVSILQPSISQSIKWNKTNEKATYDQFDRLVMEAKEKKPDLIVWPETASPDYLLFKGSVLERVRDIVKRSGAYNLVGCLDVEPLPEGDNRYFNGAVQFSPEGKTEGRYHKRHLVPFGEFVPLQKYLTFLGPVVGDLGDFDAGDRYQRFQARGFSYTPMICYEVIFPGDVREAFQTGADALVNISNDAWYGWTASAYQHAMMAVVRAAEERRPLLRSSNTGISLVTDPFGKVLASASLYEERVLTEDVLTVESGPTFYSTMGNWFPWFCLVVTLGWLFLAVFRRHDAPMAAQPLPVTLVEEKSNGA